MNNSDLKEMFAKLDTFLTLYLVKKAPSLPNNAKDIIVKFLPYLSVLFLLFSIGPMIFSLGLITIFASYSIFTIFLVISMVLSVAAIPGLFSQKKSSWTLLYYSGLVNALYSLLTLNLGSLIIGTTLCMYFLFQIRSYYK